MVSETASLLIDPQEAVDLDLWQAYDEREVADPGTSELLLPTLEEINTEWEKFDAADGHYIPDFRPRNLNIAVLDAKEGIALAYKELLKEIDADPELKQAYRWRVNEIIANIRMAKAAASGDGSRFDRYNSFIYGKADRAIFGSVAETLCGSAEGYLDSPVTAVREAAGEVLFHLDEHRGDASLIVPSNETFQAVRDEHFRPGGYFALLLVDVRLPEYGSVTHKNGGEAALEQIMCNLESDYTLAGATGATWSLDHIRERVLYPEGYDLPVERFIGLPAGHEIGSHLLERQNGQRGRVRLLKSGLDRHEIGNEGRALTREQIAYSTFDEFAKQLRWQDIMRRQLATALAEGVTGRPMKVPETYRVVNAVDRLRGLSKSPDDVEAAERRAHRRTRKLLESVYKGTDGRYGPYSRYRIYLEGNVASWRAAQEDPSIIARGDLGKYDITNHRHITVLQNQGVLPRVE
jgi:hypothetical protein